MTTARASVPALAPSRTPDNASRQPRSLDRQGRARIRLGGVGDYQVDTPDVGPVLYGTKPGDFVLLVSHNPAFVHDLQPGQVDLMLSGHTHGGQLTFFGLWPRSCLVMSVRDCVSGVGQDRRHHGDRLERRRDDLPPDEVLRPSGHRRGHAPQRLPSRTVGGATAPPRAGGPEGAEGRPSRSGASRTFWSRSARVNGFSRNPHSRLPWSSSPPVCAELTRHQHHF